VDQQDQTAVGGDSGTWEHLHVAQVFAHVLDHNLVFAEHVFDDHADLASANVDDNHAHESVDGFYARQAKRSIEAHHFSDHVAHFGQQLAADLFNIFRSQATDLFHERQWHGE